MDATPSRIAAATSRLVCVDGRTLRVCDGLFDVETIRAIDELVRTCPYTFDNADSPEDRHNRRWKAEFTAEICERQPFFTRTLQLLTEHHRGRPLQLDRIYANVNAFGERFFPHTDGESGRPGITALYYANARWEEAWGAETVFYEAGEPAFVVLPKPGRLALFDAAITHRGSPPTSVSPEPRWSIAFKISEPT